MAVSEPAQLRALVGKLMTGQRLIGVSVLKASEPFPASREILVLRCFCLYCVGGRGGGSCLEPGG